MADLDVFQLQFNNTKINVRKNGLIEQMFLIYFNIYLSKLSIYSDWFFVGQIVKYSKHKINAQILYSGIKFYFFKVFNGIKFGTFGYQIWYKPYDHRHFRRPKCIPI